MSMDWQTGVKVIAYLNSSPSGAEETIIMGSSGVSCLTCLFECDFARHE
jgi:hypothetical protein